MGLGHPPPHLLIVAAPRFPAGVPLSSEEPRGGAGNAGVLPTLIMGWGVAVAVNQVLSGGMLGLELTATALDTGEGMSVSSAL